MVGIDQQCPHHRQFQPLVQRFTQCCSRVPFLVGVLHYHMYILLVGMYSGGPKSAPEVT